MKKEKFQTVGWHSTDEQEIERRRLRGQAESMEIRCLEKEEAPFSTYVVSKSSTIYQVEIRSVEERVNSCSCPDFQTNRLGTCKHIEAVLRRCRRKKGKSNFAEIYLSVEEQPQVRIIWPEQPGALQALLSPYFSSSGALLSTDSVGAIAAIQNQVNQMVPELRGQVRLSSHLLKWVEEQKQKGGLRSSKEQFLKDVQEGKRAMQMLSTPLYPYQEEGMLHLAFQGRAMLGDEMGLGKTIQAIGAAELLRRLGRVKRVLIVCPASLKGEWEDQVRQFTPLETQIVRGSRPNRLASYRRAPFFTIANYEQIRSDFDDVQQILAPDLVILDEAQRIKNWQTKTAVSVKKLQTPFVFVLTGTPIENRIDDIYSLMQVVDPQIFGPLFRFNREFYTLDEKGKATGYKNLQELHRRLQPVLLRRVKKDVEEQLPDRTVNNFFVSMTMEQKKRYDEYSDHVARLASILKRRPLTEDETKKLQKFLACMRMVADTPYILDPTCRDCPKLEELKEILQEICQNRDNKIIIFSEWERMLSLIKEEVETMGIGFVWHTGSVAQDKRREEIRRFKEDPECRFFLTTDAGSTGLNLQVANTVINMDLPWNPAKLEQRIARAWRKHQTRAVQVINFICEDSIEQRMLTTLAQKQQLATGVLEGDSELDEMDLPSGRAAFIERLESLLSNEPTEKIIPIPPIPTEIIKNDLLSRFTDRIHLLKIYQGSSSQTLMIVVDKKTEETKAEIQQMLCRSFPDAPPSLALFDQETFHAIQTLGECGALTLKEDAGETLYQTPHYNALQVAEKEKQRQEAKKHLQEGERKMSMALLLASGGFFLESIPPAIEALVLGGRCLDTLKMNPFSDLMSLQSDLQSFLEGKSPPQEVLPILQSARETLEEISQIQAKHALGSLL